MTLTLILIGVYLASAVGAWIYHRKCAIKYKIDIDGYDFLLTIFPIANTLIAIIGNFYLHLDEEPFLRWFFKLPKQ